MRERPGSTAKFSVAASEGMDPVQPRKRAPWLGVAETERLAPMMRWVVPAKPGDTWPGPLTAIDSGVAGRKFAERTIFSCTMPLTFAVAETAEPDQWAK